MMIEFWVGIAVMLISALIIILWPLIKTKPKNITTQNQANLQIYEEQISQLQQQLQQKDITPETYKRLQQQFQQGLLDDVTIQEDTNFFHKPRPSYVTATIVSVFVIAFSMILYFKYGDSQQLAQYYFVKTHAKEIQAEIKQFKNPQQLIAKMQAILQKKPESAKGWFLLGRLFTAIMNYQQAEKAFAKAVKYDKDNLTYKLQYAQANFFANQKHLSKQGLIMLNDVLQQQPNNPAAINLVALNNFSEKNYQKAIDAWEKLLNYFPAESKDGKVILSAIKEAEQRMGIE